MTAEKETEIGFENVGQMPVADRGNLKAEKMVQAVEDKVMKEQINSAVRKETGTETPKKGDGITKDVPKLLFRFGAKIIGCPRFNLDDAEAEVFARHLNILVPIEGKMASVVVLLMITINKCYECFDAIKDKLSPKGDAPDELKDDKTGEPLPEQIQ